MCRRYFLAAPRRIRLTTKRRLLQPRAQGQPRLEPKAQGQPHPDKENRTMAISLDSIYQPLNSFFLQKFASSGDAAVIFRFAHLPRTFNDNDFLVPQHSDWGPWPGLADELFSIAVDAMPRLDDDGRTVWLSITSRLSDLYKDEILD